MNSRRSLGIVLFAAAAILLFLATRASESLSDQASNLFTGHFTDRTTWLFAAGIVSGLLGLYMVLAGAKVRRLS